MTTTERDLSVAQAAHEAGVAKHAIYEAIKRGDLHAYALSKNSTRITRTEFDRFKRSGGCLAGIDRA